jgi:spore maturation protein CgeB
VRFLIVTSDYWPFRRWLEGAHPEIRDAGYAEQLAIRASTLFGHADFYSEALGELGHEAHDVVANSELHQRAWASEHRLRIPPWAGGRRRHAVARKAWRSLGGSVDGWLLDVLAAQIRHHRPDVILNQAMHAVPGDFLREHAGPAVVLAGQGEFHLIEASRLQAYDLTVSSLPATVAWFRDAGVPSYLLRHAFHPRTLSALRPGGEVVPVSFVGGFGRVHTERVRQLEAVARRVPELRVWSGGPPSSPILRERYVGPAWGLDMYEVLARSRITLNSHGDGLEDADNCRLYEATGVGTLLVTDWKRNLHEMFEPGSEVVTYRTPEECAELVAHYLAHEDERTAVARAGQARTLREHTFRSRMEELLTLVDRHTGTHAPRRGVASRR